MGGKRESVSAISGYISAAVDAGVLSVERVEVVETEWGVPGEVRGDTEPRSAPAKLPMVSSRWPAMDSKSGGDDGCADGGRQKSAEKRAGSRGERRALCCAGAAYADMPNDLVGGIITGWNCADDI